MANYEITNITFSLRQEFTADTADATPGHAVDITTSDGIAVTGNRKRTTYLDAHIEFTYYGQIGKCVCPLQVVTVVAFDNKGGITSVTKTPIQYNDLDEVKASSDVVDAIEQEIKNIDLAIVDQNYTKTILTTYNLYT